MAGSMGRYVGDGLIKASDEAIKRKCSLLVVPSSGGARMQEGIFSLMQMPRTTVMRQSLREERLPYIVLLTNPTTGGVTASYAMLGDIHFAEPGALLAFAGARVIQGTVKEELPEGFQRVEKNPAFVDLIVERKDLSEKIGTLLSILLKKNSDISTDENEITENTQSLTKAAS